MVFVHGFLNLHPGREGENCQWQFESRRLGVPYGTRVEAGSGQICKLWLANTIVTKSFLAYHKDKAS